MQRLIRSYGRDLLRSLGLTAALSIAVGALAVVCLFLPLAVYSAEESDGALALLVAGAAGFLLIAFGGTAFFAARVLLARKRLLDAAFEPLAIPGRGYLTNGRQYHGEYRGRKVDAYFYRGPAFDLYLDCGAQTRFGAVERSALGGAIARVAGREPIAAPHPELAGLSMYAEDAGWAERWLADSSARAALLRQTAPVGEIEIRNVLLYPGMIQLKLHHTDEKRITPDAVREELEDLLRLAQTAEALPAPAPGKPLTALERNSRGNRDAFILPSILIVLGLLLVPALCMAAALILLLNLPGS